MLVIAIIPSYLQKTSCVWHGHTNNQLTPVSCLVVQGFNLRKSSFGIKPCEISGSFLRVFDGTDPPNGMQRLSNS